MYTSKKTRWYNAWDEAKMKCTPNNLCRKHKKYEKILTVNPWIQDDINESECEF